MLNTLQAPVAARAQHVVLLTAYNTRAALLAVDGAMSTTAARLCGLSLKPVGDIVEGVLRVAGVDEAEAEILRENLSAALGVRSARLEHQWPLR